MNFSPSTHKINDSNFNCKLCEVIRQVTCSLGDIPSSHECYIYGKKIIFNHQHTIDKVNISIDWEGKKTKKCITRKKFIYCIAHKVNLYSLFFDKHIPSVQTPSHYLMVYYLPWKLRDIMFNIYKKYRKDYDTKFKNETSLM